MKSVILFMIPIWFLLTWAMMLGLQKTILTTCGV
jgi:hypothetical protein